MNIIIRDNFEMTQMIAKEAKEALPFNWNEKSCLEREALILADGSYKIIPDYRNAVTNVRVK